MRFKDIKDIKGNKWDISLENGIIKLNNINDNEIVKLGDDVFVSTGWIDIHTHIDESNSFLGSKPDDVGFNTGVALLIDAGSCGLNNIDNLFNLETKTNIRALLNISKLGIPAQNELNHLSNIDINYDQIKYKNFIVGYKARISQSVVADNGVNPLLVFKKLTNNALPLMVHIGNEPPTFKDIVDQLRENDVITHIFNGKNESIFKEGEMSKTLKHAISMGIKFDIGHGTSSFDSVLFKEALRKNGSSICQFISTDIYRSNVKNGVVKDLPTTMSKINSLGLEWSKVIDCVTVNPAKHFKLSGFERIENGISDLTFFKIIKDETEVVDSKQQKFKIRERIVPIAIIVKGIFYSLKE